MTETTRTVYISEDGNEFLDKADCQRHEKIERLIDLLDVFVPTSSESENAQHRRDVAEIIVERWYSIERIMNNND